MSEHQPPTTDATEELPYLRQSPGPIAELLFRARMRVTYRVWRQRLATYGFHPRSDSLAVDVGCGSGYLLQTVASWYPQVRLIGIDPQAEYLGYAQSINPRAQFRVGDACGLPLDDRSVDVLFCIQVVEHLEDPDAFFREAARVLKPGAFLCYATPNPEGLAARVLGERWDGYRFDHIALAPPSVWRRRARDNGFTVLDDGTTFLSGFPQLRQLPFAVMNWVPLALWGYFPWGLGESYMCIARNRSR